MDYSAFIQEDAKERYSVYLENLPMSPSSNTQYKSFYSKGKVRHVKNDTYIDYQNAMKMHYLKNVSSFHLALRMIQDWKKEGAKFQFNAVFYFNYSRVFTKEGKSKKLDISNRIKALHDVICEYFDFDDCEIFRLFAEKSVIRDGEDEKVTVEIFPITQ